MVLEFIEFKMYISSTGRLLIYPKAFTLRTFCNIPITTKKKCLTLKTLFTSEKDLTFNEAIKIPNRENNLF